MSPMNPAAIERMRERARSRLSRVKRGDDIFPDDLAPRTWAEYVGQELVKDQLRWAIKSAQARNVRLDHTLLAGGPGIGKSALARIIVSELGAGMIEVSGPMNLADAREVLFTLGDGDVLFWDEIHTAVAGGKARAEWLLPWMTDGVLVNKQGAIPTPDVTLIGATTDVGRLPETIVDRFMLQPGLVGYDCDAMLLIVKRLAKRMGLTPDSSGDLYWLGIVEACNRSPRMARRILTHVRDLPPDRKWRTDIAFRWAGVTWDGIDRTGQNMLLALLAQSDHTASLETIQAMLGEVGPLIHTERALIQRGLITITGRGRRLTDDGAERAAELLEEEGQ